MPPKKAGGPAGGLPIHVAIEKGQDGAVAELLSQDKAGCLEARNKDGWTPLCQAAYCGEADICSMLIKEGANVTAQCKDGCTALHYASAQGHADIIKILAAAGAKLTVQDKDGETPFDVAGTNLKVRKLIQSLVDAADEEEDVQGEEDEGEEWEEADAEDIARELAAKAAVKAAPAPKKKK